MRAYVSVYLNLVEEYNAHAGSVKCLALGQKNGRFLATGGGDKKVNIWTLDKPNCLMVCFRNSSYRILSSHFESNYCLYDT
jgi:WD40 repeat protein